MNAVADVAEPEALGALLRRHRRAQRLTQRELAELAALSESLIHQIEVGVLRHPQRNTMMALCLALGLRGDERRAWIVAAGHDAGRIDYGSAFGQLLQGYRLAAGLSQNALGKRAGVGPTTILRLERGDRDGPGRDTVMALARGLALEMPATDRLLFAAGFAPTVLQWLGWEHGTLQAVLRVLASETLSERARGDFAMVVATLARRWCEGGGDGK